LTPSTNKPASGILFEFAEIWVVCSALDSFLQSHDKLKTSQ
jgi:hypothetical protein